jgi:hypothetical protein
VLGFVGVFLLPLDICVTLATNCASPIGIVHAWEFVYWTTLIMAWVIDPLLQSFHNDGAYDWQTRLKNAVKENIRFYVIVIGIIVAVCLVVFMFLGIPADLNDIIVGVANAYGLLLMILMLGYGMIAVRESFNNFFFFFLMLFSPANIAYLLSNCMVMLQSLFFFCDFCDLLLGTKRFVVLFGSRKRIGKNVFSSTSDIRCCRRCCL